MKFNRESNNVYIRFRQIYTVLQGYSKKNFVRKIPSIYERGLPNKCYFIEVLKESKNILNLMFEEQDKMEKIVVAKHTDLQKLINNLINKGNESIKIKNKYYVSSVPRVLSAHTLLKNALEYTDNRNLLNGDIDTEWNNYRLLVQSLFGNDIK